MDFFANMCRICMSKDSKLINLYSNDDDLNTFIDKLNTCVPEIFTEENYILLPDSICISCCNHLRIAFSFHELCIKSNAQLHNQKLKVDQQLAKCIKTEYIPESIENKVTIKAEKNDEEQFEIDRECMENKVNLEAERTIDEFESNEDIIQNKVSFKEEKTIPNEFEIKTFIEWNSELLTESNVVKNPVISENNTIDRNNSGKSSMIIPPKKIRKKSSNILKGVEKYGDGQQSSSTSTGRPLTPKPSRLIDRHFVDYIPSDSSRANVTRRCKLCYSKGFRKESRFWCPDCGVTLCMPHCFKEYHTTK